MVKHEMEIICSCCISCTAIARYTEMCSAIRLCLILCCWDRYIVISSILTRIINLIRSFICEFARNFKLKRCNLTSWSVIAYLPNIVVVLHVNLVACFPIESTAVIIHRCARLWSATNKLGEVFVVVCIFAVLCYVFASTRNCC